MENKNSTQVFIPFDFKEKNIGLYARQSWNTTFGRQQNVGVMPKRIMVAVLSQIKKEDLDFKPFYRFHVSEFALPNQDVRALYKELKTAFIKLTDLKWFFEDLNKEDILKSKFAVRHLLNTSDINCGYDNGYLTIVLNPILKPLFIEIAHYTTFDLKWYMTFSSWYSMRLFEILSAYKDTGWWEVSIDEYRAIMDCENKFSNPYDLIKKTTTTPLLELEKTKMAFTVEPITQKMIGQKGRPPIVSLKFTLKNAQPKIKAIPNDWFKNPDHSKLLEKMKNRYKLSEANIVKYSNVIGLKSVKELLNSWDIKEASSDPIKNKLHYCNLVFVAMGKKVTEEK